MNKMLKNSLLSASVLLLMGGAMSCKDDLTLSGTDAKDLYITILNGVPTNGRLEMSVATDTIDLKALVRNAEGKDISDAQVTWSSADESKLKIIDGNRLIALAGSEGSRDIEIRATLQNGRYARNLVTVRSANSLDLTVMLADDKALSGPMYITPGSPFHFIVNASSASLLATYPLAFEGVDDALMSVEERQFNSAELNVKEATAKKMPNAKWYTITPAPGAQGSARVVVKVGNKQTAFDVIIGTVVTEVNAVNEVTRNGALEKTYGPNFSKPVDINSRHTIKMRVKMAPSTQEAFDDIKDEFKWNITGSAAMVTAKDAHYDADGCIFEITIQTGALEGTFSAEGSLQGKSAVYALEVKDFAATEFTDLNFAGLERISLPAGGVKSFRMRVTPRPSQAVILADIDNMVRFSVPGIAEFQNDNGSYSIRGLASGNTELIVTVRGQEYRLPIEVRATARLVSIDNTIANTIMLGDAIDWRAQVQMAGSDAPDYNLVTWTVADPAVTVEGLKKGQTIKLVGSALHNGVDIVAVYEDAVRSQARKLRVVPVVPNIQLTPSDYNIDGSGIDTSSSELKVILEPLPGKDVPTEFIIRPRSGSIALASREYNANDYIIIAKWANGLEKQATGSIRITAAGGKYNLNYNLVLTLANGTTRTITGTLDGLGG